MMTGVRVGVIGEHSHYLFMMMVVRVGFTICLNDDGGTGGSYWWAQSLSVYDDGGTGGVIGDYSHYLFNVEADRGGGGV